MDKQRFISAIFYIKIYPDLQLMSFIYKRACVSLELVSRELWCSKLQKKRTLVFQTAEQIAIFLSKIIIVKSILPVNEPSITLGAVKTFNPLDRRHRTLQPNQMIPMS